MTESAFLGVLLWTILGKKKNYISWHLVMTRLFKFVLQGQLNPHSCGVLADATTQGSSNAEYYTGSWTDECSGSQPSGISTSIQLNSFSLTPSFILISYTRHTLPPPQVHELHIKQYNRHCLSASGKQCLFHQQKAALILKWPKSLQWNTWNKWNIFWKHLHSKRNVAFASSINIKTII